MGEETGEEETFGLREEKISSRPNYTVPDTNLGTSVTLTRVLEISECHFAYVLHLIADR